MKRRALIGALPALGLGAVVHAQGAASAPAGTHRYVGMSLIGDQLTFVGASPGVTGSLVERGLSKVVPMAGAPFDRTALEVLASVVPAADPGAAISFLASSAPASFSGQEDWFDGNKLTLPAALRDSIRKEGAGRLLLLTKLRSDMRISDSNSTWGSGKLSGLGFYTDPNQQLFKGGTAEVVQGYVAPYVYVKLSLVDVATFQVIGQHDIDEATPYVSLTSQEMFDTLQSMLVAQLKHAVTLLLKPA